MKKILPLLVITFGLSQITKGQEVITTVDCNQTGLVVNVGSYPNMVSLYHSGNYLTWSQTFNPLLVVNHFYNVELFSDFAFWNTNYSLWQNWNELWNDDSNFKNVFYRDRIFCTDQLVDQKNGDLYDINKGQFVTTSAGNNEYIVTS